MSLVKCVAEILLRDTTMITQNHWKSFGSALVITDSVTEGQYDNVDAGIVSLSGKR